jgi:hypothetical protein
LQQRRLVVSGPERPARELLAALEILVGARWYQVETRLVLATDPVIARLAIMSDAELIAWSDGELRRGLDLLPPDLVQRLVNGEMLTEDQLPPAPRQALHYGAVASVMAQSMLWPDYPMKPMDGQLTLHYSPLNHEVTLGYEYPGREATQVIDVVLPRAPR